MLTIKECRKYLEKYNLTDEQIEKIRNILYCISENIIENHIKRKKDQFENSK